MVINMFKSEKTDFFPVAIRAEMSQGHLCIVLDDNFTHNILGDTCYIVGGIIRNNFAR